MKYCLLMISLFFFLGCSVFKKNTKNDEYEEASSVPPKIEDMQSGDESTEKETLAQLQAKNDELNSKLTHAMGAIENLSQQMTDFKKSHDESIVSLDERMKLLEDEIQRISLSDEKEVGKYRNASSLYKFAKSEMARDERKAILAFRRLVEKYPTSTLVDDSSFQLGEIYFKNKDYKGAIIEFDFLRKNYPKSSLLVSTIFKEALCFENLGETQQARSLFQFIIDNYPQHKLSEEAKKHL